MLLADLPPPLHQVDNRRFLGERVRPLSVERRRRLVEREQESLSAAPQCALLAISRSGLYRRRAEVSEEDEELLGLMQRQYPLTPYDGSRRMTVRLRSLGIRVNRKRARRLMRAMGLQAVYRCPNASRPAKGRKVYP